MDPYTPRTRPGGRKKNLGLSAKEYTKITGTIASVRRNRQLNDDIFEDGDVRVRSSRESRGKSHEPSFIAEISFVRAPLNSRVGASASIPKSKGKTREDVLDNLPVDIQEALILEDLLYVLMGIEGTYISYHPEYSQEDDDPLKGISFVVSSPLDSSLRDLTERILPLGTYYTAISSFVESRSHLDFGLVNHALCAAIRDMLKVGLSYPPSVVLLTPPKDYQTLLSQLEHAFNTSPQFSLQKLWFYVHPTVHTLSLIYQLILELATTDDDDASSSSSSSESDPEQAARDEALGLGGAKLKAVLSDMKKSTSDAPINVKGGEVLTVIYERMQTMSGDPTAVKVYGTLLTAAGVPYVEMLRVWTTTGRLEDPYEELCVKESKFISKGILEVDYTDEYWERRYTLRDGSTLSSKRQHTGIPPPRTPGGRLPGGACIPPLLEGWKHKFLLAGKYLNVIRECGIEVQADQKDLTNKSLSMEDEKLYKFIEDAYTHANRTLLRLLLQDQQLIPRLRSLKRYFFLSSSSFLTHLLDLAHIELKKPAKGVSIVKLQSLLDLSLTGEDAAFREDVRVSIASSVAVIGGEEGEGVPDDDAKKDRDREKEKDDKKPMLAIDALTLDYNVKFPLSLVISRKTILRYQLLFRFLLHLKHVEQSLASMWIEQKTTPWRRSVPNHPEFEQWRLRVALLRARMLAFVQQILAFTTFEVLEPNWRALEAKLAKVTTVDQLLRDHVDFLDTCLKECMLTSAKLLRSHARRSLCTPPSFTKSANQALAAAESDDGDQAMNKRWEFLKKFESNFNHWFKFHLDCVQYYASSENVSLLPLVVRLSSIKAMS
ncbi:Spc98 family-domain-containing protein [Suillus paluster]|uniref:Spc98 family-domain-containing protein n=1 Tax=Suillus paluster TaxID=48578 RepID=UPI001B8860DB|nr:Spc98 family-domain-containing protein [Suillus paluster]KAG1733900.1 Spc98 family-domain-containing protein [Suillus paluster]